MILKGDEFRHKFSYSQLDVDLYSKVSGDTNPLHTDPEVGKTAFSEEILFMVFWEDRSLLKYLALFGWSMVMSILNNPCNGLSRCLSIQNTRQSSRLKKYFLKKPHSL